MALLRRVGGHLEAQRGPGSAAALLPYELALINELGLSIDEYREFQRLTVEYSGERKDGIPAVNNDPITLTVVSLVVGVALTAAASMMKPKPPKPVEPDEMQNLETGDNVGRSKFTPRYGFDSVQSLATLGKPIPLVFARRCNASLQLKTTPDPSARVICGGVRVNTQLLWSQLMSVGYTQELRVAAMLGLSFGDSTESDLEKRPEYEGYAIGSTKLESLPPEQIRLAFNENGGRPSRSNSDFTYEYKEGDLKLPDGTPDDLLAVRIYSNNDGIPDWNPVSSSTHTPNTARSFGCHGFMPNGTAWMENFNSQLVPFNSNDGVKLSSEEARNEIRMTLIKDNIYMYPYGAGFFDPDDNDRYRKGGGQVSVTEGNKVYYKISSWLLKDDLFNEQSVSGANDFITAKREEIDGILQVGEVYQINNFKARLEERPGDVLEGVPDGDRVYVFKALEKGQYRIMPGFDEGNDLNQRFVVAGYSGIKIEAINDLGGNRMGDNLDDPDTGNNSSPTCALLSRADDAIVSNTRRCNVTEIGIKSNVWRRIQMPNINSFPKKDATENLRSGGKDVLLGNMSRYCKRYSFFKIFYRRSGFGNDATGVGNDWEQLHQNVKFAVLGKTPEDKYHFIRITYPEGELDAYEFKITPVPGYAVWQDIVNNRDERIWLLENGQRTSFGGTSQGIGVANGFRITFSGRSLLLDKTSTFVPEFSLGPLVTLDGKGDSTKGDDPQYEYDGAVRALSTYDNGIEPKSAWVEIDTRYTDPSQETPTNFTIPRNKVVQKKEGNRWVYTYFWDDVLLHTRKKANGDPENAGWYDDPTTGFRYDLGRETSEGNPQLNIRRFYIKKFEYIKNPSPNRIFGGKEPDNKGDLRGEGLSLKVYAYDDPFDPNDQTKDAASWEIENSGEGYKDGEEAKFTIRGRPITIKLFTAQEVGQIDYYPYAALSDYPQYQGEELSCDNGPEFEVMYVNEQIFKFGNQASYDDLAYATLRIRANRQLQSFSQFSAYVKTGIKVERLVSDTDLQDTLGLSGIPDRYATCLLPEIVYALLSDPVLGVGELVGRYQIDRSSMINAANYCLRNGFTWNGVLAERVNIREWIYQQATHNLLDFTVIGGRFALTPSLLTNSKGEIDLTKTPPIKALFTDGNIKDLTCNFLDPSDRQLFTATALWRVEEGNGFPQTMTTTVSLSENQSNPGLQGGRPGRDVVETFDLSDSVTSEAHVVAFLKMALRARQCIDHSIEFTTTTNEMMGISPGDYIKVSSEASHSRRWNNGSIGSAGQVTLNDSRSGDLNVLYWKPGFDRVKEATINIQDGQITNAALFNTVITVKNESVNVRTYRISTISYGEEGEVQVTAAHSPLTTKYNPNGSLLLADWDENDFDVLTAV
jgi:hypothetical protein